MAFWVLEQTGRGILGSFGISGAILSGVWSVGGSIGLEAKRLIVGLELLRAAATKVPLGFYEGKNLLCVLLPPGMNQLNGN